MANVKEMKERTIDLRGTDSTPRLTVEHTSGDIEIRTWDQPQVRLEIPDHEDGDIEEMFVIRAEDGHVYVGNGWHGRGRDDRREQWREQWREQGRQLGRQVEEALRQGDFAAIGEQVTRMFGGMSGPRPDVDLRITVPARCDVAVRTINGDVRLGAITGNIYLESASGEMHLDGAQGTLLVKTASGDFHSRSFSGRLGVRSASGDVHIDGATLQACNIGTVSGDVQVIGRLAPDGEYGLRTTSGDVELALPEDTACTVRVRTVSGDINCDLPYDRTRESRRNLSLAINGGGPLVDFGSISGDLSIIPWDGTTPAPVDLEDAESANTRRLRREDAPSVDAPSMSAGETARYTGSGRATGPLADSGPSRPSAEMTILEAIERGELSVDEGLTRLSELQ